MPTNKILEKYKRDSIKNSDYLILFQKICFWASNECDSHDASRERIDKSNSNNKLNYDPTLYDRQPLFSYVKAMAPHEAHDFNILIEDLGLARKLQRAKSEGIKQDDVETIVSASAQIRQISLERFMAGYIQFAIDIPYNLAATKGRDSVIKSLLNEYPFKKHATEIDKIVFGQEQDDSFSSLVVEPNPEPDTSIENVRGSEEDQNSGDSLTHPGIFRRFLDRFAPALHDRLMHWGIVSKPPELEVLRTYLDRHIGELKHEFHEKKYLPLLAQDLRHPLPPLITRSKTDGPIQRTIRQLQEVAKGGDAASPQIAAIHKTSQKVRNLIRVILGARDPLVLLGDPGTGKTWTLKEAMLELAQSERRKAFPKIVVFVRLSEFFVTADTVNTDDVLAYIRRSVPSDLKPLLKKLEEAERLVIIFDGMDEMSRKHYAAHTSALSRFAAGHPNIRTLFSCRITDFSSEFIHRKLVLLPFTEAQIHDFLCRYTNYGFPVKIGDQVWTSRRLAKALAQGDMAMDPSNPFVLWLLCIYLWEKNTWPAHRVELLKFYCEQNFHRIYPEKEQDHKACKNAFQAWGEIAYRITENDQGGAIALEALSKGWHSKLPMIDAIRFGTRCGILEEITDVNEKTVKFEHKRFQEFFAALHIHQEHRSMNWLDKLDAPRWQETMLNSILFGGGQEAIAELQQSILEPIVALETEQAAMDSSSGGEEKPVLPRIEEEMEIKLADRIELAARLVRKAGKVLVDTRDQLFETTLRGINLLIERGNPISQVKMIQACYLLPDIDREKVMAKPLESNIDWVKHQAFTVLAADPGKTSLTKRLVYDLASQKVLPNIRGYFTAARKAKQQDLQVLTFLAGLLHLLLLAFPLILGWTLNGVFFTPSFGPEFMDVVGGWIRWFAAILTACAMFIFWSKGALAQLFISLFGPTTVTILSAITLNLSGIVIPDLWKTSLGVIFVCAVLTLYLVSIVMVLHGLCLALFLGVTRVAGRSITKQWPMFRILWQQIYQPVLNKNSAPLLLIIPAIPFGIAVLLWLVRIAYVSIVIWFYENPQTVASAHGQLEFALQVITGNLHLWIALLTALIAFKIASNQKSIKQWGYRQWGIGRILLAQNPWIKFLPLWTIGTLLFLYALTASPLATGVILAGGTTWIFWRRDHRPNWASILAITSRIFGFLFLSFMLLTIGFLLLSLVVTTLESPNGILASALSLILGIIICIVTLYFLIYTITHLSLRLRRHAITSKWVPNTFILPKNLTAEDWRSRIQALWNDPERQDFFLRVDKATLGLTIKDYLRHLKELEDSISSSPAENTYWSKRFEAEESLKQERKG